jgi:hypothetical protein
MMLVKAIEIGHRTAFCASESAGDAVRTPKLTLATLEAASHVSTRSVKTPRSKLTEKSGLRTNLSAERTRKTETYIANVQDGNDDGRDDTCGWP